MRFFVFKTKIIFIITTPNYPHTSRKRPELFSPSIIYNIEKVELTLNANIKNTYSKNTSRDFMMELEELINQLPEKQKWVCSLIYLCRASSKEVAEELECSLHSVHQNLYLARQNLRKFMSMELGL